MRDRGGTLKTIHHKHLKVTYHNCDVAVSVNSVSLYSVDDVFSDGISVTGLPISSPLRQVLKPRAESKSVGSESGRAEYSHIKVSSFFGTTGATLSPLI